MRSLITIHLMCFNKGNVIQKDEKISSRTTFEPQKFRIICPLLTETMVPHEMGFSKQLLNLLMGG